MLSSRGALGLQPLGSGVRPTPQNYTPSISHCQLRGGSVFLQVGAGQPSTVQNKPSGTESLQSTGKAWQQTIKVLLTRYKAESRVALNNKRGHSDGGREPAEILGPELASER